MRKVNIYMSDFYRYEMETDVSFIDEDFLYDVPEDLIQEYEELKKKSHEVQKKIQNIYKERNG